MKFVKSWQKRNQKDVNEVVPVSLLLTLKIFYTLFYFFDCWPWSSKNRLICNLNVRNIILVSIMSTLSRYLFMYIILFWSLLRQLWAGVCLWVFVYVNFDQVFVYAVLFYEVAPIQSSPIGKIPTLKQVP